MNIIYVSSSCSDKKFDQLRENRITNSLPQAQKYHKLLMEGLAEIDGCNVISLSALPVSGSSTKKRRFEREEETVNKVKYIYERFVNFPVLRQLSRYFGVKKNIKKLSKGEKDTVIICDILNQSVADGARKCAKKYGFPVVGIVTDVPGHMSGADISLLPLYQKIIYRLLEKKAERSIEKYHAYLFLTEEMNSIVNKGKRPYIVIEGHCDSRMADIKKKEKTPETKNIMLYSGGIHKEYGIDTITYAFCDCDFQDWEFHIYGTGNFQDELEEICRKNPSVKYLGLRANSEIVKKQVDADLLVNPRSTDSEFVKYSFPSKTMEYMASGTATLTTRLPGMPKEYYKYMYFFEEETRNAMAETLRKVTSISHEERFKKGEEARSFVLNEKNNIKQAQKLREFIEEITKG